MRCLFTALLLILSGGLVAAQDASRDADGPYLIHGADGGVRAVWVEDGAVQRASWAKGEAPRLPRFASLTGDPVRLRPHQPPAPVWPQPPRLLVISDAEGEYELLVRFLRGNGVIDKAGKWAFGKGHLVCVGDMVDRGDKVTEVLWLCWRLAREAEAAGGRLHMLTGNHEAMLLGGDIRYVHPKYKRVAKLLGRPVEGLLGADTELGRWLRTRNAVVRVGDYVFAHGGISPQLSERGLDLKGINDDIRSILGTPPGKIEDRWKRSLAWGRTGPLWYRGYFPRYAKGQVPSAELLDLMLGKLKAKHIVVGHCKVKRIEMMHGGRVIAIDIPWDGAAQIRGLLVSNGQRQAVDIDGRRAPIE